MTTQQLTTQDELAAKRALVAEQREVNENMLLAMLRVMDETDQAEAARLRIEATMGELRASQERYRTLFELSPTAIYTCDATGVIQDFNRHAAALWGREPVAGDTNERFCGSFKLLRQDGAFVPHERCPMAEVVSGKVSEVRDEEILIERPDGSRVVVVVNIRSLRNELGDVVGAINCFYDVTERKAAEERLAASLSRARELAEFREMFIGILGHDLRTPLAAILASAAGLLRRGHLNDEDSLSLARIIRGSQRMNRMIIRLLDLTRDRLGGGLSLDLKPADLRETCQGVAEQFETRLQLELDGELTGIWDDDRLAEVLSNLVANALRFAAPETAVVIKAHAEDTMLVIEVENQGEPISPEVLPHLFEPFRRTRGVVRTVGNLGLGLYIARQIALAHGGTLDGNSAGGTTTFTLRIPRAQGSALPLA